jgi:hypothetical protein
MSPTENSQQRFGFNDSRRDKQSAGTGKSFSPQDIAMVAVFGALWGLMEVTLGVTLKGLRIPMSGAILTAIASIIFLTGRYFVRQRGSILMMGVVAALLKIFSIGTVIAGPFIAILLEAVFAEFIISLLGVNRLSYLITPIFLLLYTIIHPFISQGILFGDDIYAVYVSTLKKIANVLNLGLDHLIWIALLYAGIHVILGSLTGWIAFSLAQKVEQELTRTTDNIGIRS